MVAKTELLRTPAVYLGSFCFPIHLSLAGRLQQAVPDICDTGDCDVILESITNNFTTLGINLNMSISIYQKNDRDNMVFTEHRFRLLRRYLQLLFKLIHIMVCHSDFRPK